MPQSLPRLWTCIALFAIGCARAKASETAPASAPAEPSTEDAPQQTAAPSDATASTEFRTLAEAESALEQAKKEIDALAFAAPPPSPGAAAPAKKEAERSSTGAAEEQGAGPSCEGACRAFGSLLRAASAVCRLDTENGERCARAKQVVEAAQRRVSSCGCER